MLVFHASTRGKKYEIRVFKEDDESYSIRYYTKGYQYGSGVGHNRKSATHQIHNDIRTAKRIDKINYEIDIDELTGG